VIFSEQGGQSSLSSMAISGAWVRTWIQMPLSIERKARAMKKAAMGRVKKMNGWVAMSSECR